jgi:transposase InsO family protein
MSRWPKATKAEKSAIPDAVCEVTGWHRDHARKAIRTALADRAAGGPPPRKQRDPVLVYGEEAVELLTRCWAVLDGPTGKRLHPALPGVVASMERHGHLAGVDPAALTQVPGFVQIDLVGHEGGDNNGEFFFTLDATDVATGWTESVTVRSKGERIVAAGLEQLWLRFPFHIAGIHSDNGSEFINHHLARWCETRKITFARGRASNKNDQAHVEQKNWSVVRRSVGYFRYDTRRELDLLNQLWPLVSAQVNLFLPQQKLVSKTRTGAVVRKRHDTAATPLKRLLTEHADLLDPHDRQHLESLLETTDLIALRHQITDIQANLIELARRRGLVQTRAKTNAVYLSRRKMNPPKRASSDESTNPIRGHLDMSQQDRLYDAAELTERGGDVGATSP